MCVWYIVQKKKHNYRIRIMISTLKTQKIINIKTLIILVLLLFKSESAECFFCPADCSKHHISIYSPTQWEQSSLQRPEPAKIWHVRLETTFIIRL